MTDIDSKVKNLISKLSNPLWVPTRPAISNPEGNLGAVNIMWVLCGMPERFDSKLFEGNGYSVWVAVKHFGSQLIDKSTVEEYATLLSPEEFYYLMKKHESLVEKYFEPSFFYTMFYQAAMRKGI